MVMVVTIKSNVFEEVVFQEINPLKGKEPQDWQEEEKFMQLMVKTIEESQKDEQIQKLQ
jgi:hypothetical protein